MRGVEADLQPMRVSQLVLGSASDVPHSSATRLVALLPLLLPGKANCPRSITSERVAYPFLLSKPASSRTIERGLCPHCFLLLRNIFEHGQYVIGDDKSFISATDSSISPRSKHLFAVRRRGCSHLQLVRCSELVSCRKTLLLASN